MRLADELPIVPFALAQWAESSEENVGLDDYHDETYELDVWGGQVLKVGPVKFRHLVRG
jgi:hypothetical protein